MFEETFENGDLSHFLAKLLRKSLIAIVLSAIFAILICYLFAAL